MDNLTLYYQSLSTYPKTLIINMYSTKRYLHHAFIYLFIALFTIGINPSIAFAGRTPAQQTTSTSTTPTKPKKAKKKRKNKRAKSKHKKPARTYWYSDQTWALLGIIVEVGATFMWLFGWFAGFPIIMFIGLGILFLMGIAPLAIIPFVGAIVLVLAAITIGLFLLGFFMGSWLLMVSMMVLLIIQIITGIIAAYTILNDSW